FAASRLSFLTPESQERSFSGENHLFKLAVGTAAVADGRGQPWNFIDFSKAVIADVVPISSSLHLQTSKADIRGK
ncbi:MAG TPA: hypothetical protein PLB25_10155, partial [Rhodoferax sp.]|nr:hypothetical protein [Rhodoferax sp.]